MSKLLRLLVSLFAVLSLGAALAACGDDDDDDAATTTTEAEGDDEATDEGEDEAPDVNPCAEGESGTFDDAPPVAPAAGATPVTISASEYAFAGTEALAAVGSYAVSLENVGQELHELVIQQLAADETRPLEELIALPEPPPTTDVAFAFACPGATADAVGVELTEPGRYVVLCFLPTGLLPTTPPEEIESLGPPHAFQGMALELQVT